MEKIQITYIGFSEELIEILLFSEKFELVSVILQAERINNKLTDLLDKKGIQHYFIHDKSDLANLKKWIKSDVVLMYKFSWIIPEKIVGEYKIFNIHPGELRNNRGAHPFTWSILLGMEKTCASLYQLGSDVDLGLLIAEFWVNIDKHDDTKSLELKLIEGFPVMLESLYSFLLGKLKGIKVSEGIYRQKVCEKDYTIDVYNDSEKVIRNKIQSQKQYNGAILYVNGYRFRVSDFEE